MKRKNEAVDDFVRELKKFVQDTERDVHELSQALLTPTNSDTPSEESKKAASHLLEVISESIQSTETEFHMVEGIGGVLNPSAQSLVNCCEQLVEEQSKALSELQQMATQLGFNPYASAPLRTISHNYNRQSAPILPVIEKTLQQQQPHPQQVANTTSTITAANLQQLKPPSLSDFGISEETQKTIINQQQQQKTTTTKQPEQQPQPQQQQKGTGDVGLKKFKSLEDVGDNVPGFLMAQVTLEKLNICVEKLEETFNTLKLLGKPCEITTEEATHILGKELEQIAKTLLLILQKAGRLKLIVVGSATKWTPI